MKNEEEVTVEVNEMLILKDTEEPKKQVVDVSITEGLQMQG